MSERKWHIAGDILVPVRSSEDHGRFLCSYMVVVSVVPFATVFEDECGTLRVNEQVLDPSGWKVIGTALDDLMNRCDAVYNDFLDLKGVVKRPVQNPVQTVEKVVEKVDTTAQKKPKYFMCCGRFYPHNNFQVARLFPGREIKYNESWTIYICAKNKTEAAKMLAAANDDPLPQDRAVKKMIREINVFHSKQNGDQWIPNSMKGIKLEYGAWIEPQNEKVVRIV